MTESQQKAFDKLESLYDQYPIKPKRFGFTERVHNVTPYDVPGRLRDWSKDKRETNIPSYVKVQNESEGTTAD
jgi:hypothetical protein